MRAPRRNVPRHTPAPRSQPAPPRAGEMETQLHDVLALWENAASEARGEAAAEVAELRKQARATACACAELRNEGLTTPCSPPQVEQLQEKLTTQDSAARSSEATMRGEMDQIMRLWEEAQRNSAAEVEALQDRICELRSGARDGAFARNER